MDSHHNLAAGGGGRSEGFLSWFAERTRMSGCHVDRAPLTELRGWAFDEATGNLGHESGRFFVVEGLHVRTSYGAVREWSQPIINQPEIGILGLLVKMVDGVPHCLVQAKMEPGDLNTMQLSPIVQATRSNYAGVHRGSRVKYLEYFTRPPAGQVLVDDDLHVSDEHRWLSLPEIRRLLRIDGLVNTDTRTVLSCLPAFFFSDVGSALTEEGMAAALARSVNGQGTPHHGTVDVLSWFTSAKSRHELAVRRVPLRGLPGWRGPGEEITHEDGRHFSIVGVTVRANHREAAEWDQPLLHPQGCGLVAFVVKNVDGVAHLLVHARFQAGLLDAMEMGPTVQCNPENHPGGPPIFLDYVLGVSAERILYDTVLAEEGGRFHHSQNRYLLVEADEDFPLEVPVDFCWVTAHQLTTLLRHGYYVNVEARSLLTCLHSLW
ncbi:NDP-hexose 2,3-dehydratase family protein [Nonomuraea purpurea]|uniref:NDP-hexose 2,3-dehydratase family protein n=1 Tax=Nonomuraea purpurea TaxID=1849276 RepID=A0ABV8GIF1_9ACTN